MTTSASSPRPPKHLSKESRAWWTSVAKAFVLEPHHFRLLTLACEALDRATEARLAVAADGAVQRDRFGQLRPHPMLSVERDARVGYARLLRELRLDDAPADARPPRGGRKW